MTDIHIKNKKDDILVKDCMDFVPLKDGTLAGDKKYCDLSFQCKQVDMASDRVEFRDVSTDELIEIDYFCTGKYAIKEECGKDEKAE